MSQMFFKRVVFAGMLLSAAAATTWASPCDNDIAQSCHDVQPGQGALAACINSNLQNFSSQCREWISKTDYALRRLGTECMNDAREYCRDVRPGYGRLVGCLRSNMDKLSTGCQDALNNK